MIFTVNKKDAIRKELNSLATSIRLGYITTAEKHGKNLDKLHVSYSIQNKVAYLAKYTNKYITDIVKESI